MACIIYAQLPTSRSSDCIKHHRSDKKEKEKEKKIRSSTIAQKHNLSDWIKEEISELNKHFRPTLIIINNIF